MKKLVLAFLAALATSSDAAVLSLKWDSDPAVDLYEYQISKTNGFSKEQIIDKGRTKQSQITIDVAPGAYFVRLRARSQDGLWSSWSEAQPSKAVGPAPQVKTPNEGQVQRLAANELLKLVVKASEKPDDIEVTLESGKGERRIIIGEGPDFSVPDLASGEWLLSAKSRWQGIPSLASEKIRFRVLREQSRDSQDSIARSLRILDPVDPYPTFSDSESWAIQLADIEGYPQPSFQLRVWRMGPNAGLILQEDFLGTQVRMPLLPPGVYLAVVEWRGTQSEPLDSKQISFTVVDDVTEGFRGASFLEFSPPTIGVFLGRYHLKSRFLPLEPDDSTHAQNPYVNFLSQGSWRFSKHWEYTGLLEVFYTTPRYPNGLRTPSTVSGLRIVSDAQATSARIRQAVGYSAAGRESVSSVHFLGGFSYRYFRNFIAERDNLLLSNLGALAITGGAKWRYRFRPSWESLLEAWTEVPVLTERGRVLGRGTVKPIPNLLLSARLKKRIADEWFFNFGGELQMDVVSHGEGQAAASTNFHHLGLGAVASLSWML